jgi:Family of unknown function (DUF5302)
MTDSAQQRAPKSEAVQPKAAQPKAAQPKVARPKAAQAEAKQAGAQPADAKQAAAGQAAPESATPEPAAPEPAEAHHGDGEAKPDLDEVKRKFREALDRKRQAHAEGQDRGGQDTGKIHGAHGPAASRRSFRRKSG